MLEVYQAYADYRAGMDLTESARGGGVRGRERVPARRVPGGARWNRAPVAPAAVLRSARASHGPGSSPRWTRTRSCAALADRSIQIPPGTTTARLVDELFSATVQLGSLRAHVRDRSSEGALAAREGASRTRRSWSSDSSPYLAGMEIGTVSPKLRRLRSSMGRALRGTDGARWTRGRHHGARRAVPPRSRTRHASGLGTRRGDRPARDGAHESGADPRGHPLPANASEGHGGDEAEESR